VPGLLIVAFFATLLVLRLTRAPGGSLTGGIVLMGFGVWLLLDATKHSRFAGSLVEPPQVFVLMLGLWCVVKGALRMAER
jgi:multisubunit Na+/H+ antiporter MnhB subunit